VLRGLDGALSGELGERYRDFRGRYLRDLESVFYAMRQTAAERSAARLRPLRSAIEPFLDLRTREQPLSRQALLLLRSLPGVSSVLLGARKPEYVDDALAALALPKVEDARRALAALREN